MATYCIICGKKKKGVAVTEDRVLRLLRWFKGNVTHDLKGNSLVVCDEDLEAYKKKRDHFNSRQKIYLALGVIFAILGLIASFSLKSITVSALVIVALYLISLINYTPGLVTENKKYAIIKHKQ